MEEKTKEEKQKLFGNISDKEYNEAEKWYYSAEKNEYVFEKARDRIHRLGLTGLWKGIYLAHKIAYDSMMEVCMSSAESIMRIKQ